MEKLSDIMGITAEVVESKEYNLPAEPVQTKDLAVSEPKMQPKEVTMWNDVATFETSQRMAKLLAASEIAPQNYRGKVADCMIAIDMANRMGVSPMVIMQNSQVVRGNFSWKGTACKSMIDSCGRYKKTRYVEVGEVGKDSQGVYLEAETKDGEIIKGVTVTVEMAKKEGWWQNTKWQTMTSLMLRYRAAAFFMRTECASIAMGFLISEEQEDIRAVEQK